jgi:hypothetical protein
MCIIDENQLLTLSHKFSEIRGLKPRYVSTLLFSDNKRLNAIASGSDVGVRRLRRAWQYLDENWPADRSAEWPRGIPRPPRSPEPTP